MPSARLLLGLVEQTIEEGTTYLYVLGQLNTCSCELGVMITCLSCGTGLRQPRARKRMLMTLFWISRHFAASL
jgi:hypothetical protein